MGLLGPTLDQDYIVLMEPKWCVCVCERDNNPKQLTHHYLQPKYASFLSRLEGTH